MRDVICSYHAANGAQSWLNHTPVISCAACRQSGYFSAQEVCRYLAQELKFTVMGGRVVVDNGTVMRVVPQGAVFETGIQHFNVYLVKGAWPEKKRLLELCGDKPFAGHVFYDGVVAKVDCYFD